ncbi:MAG: response regulator, partial [Gemmatimonadota bacterium]|nr:response regulator [Gemmatimonadota bacterium]
MDTARILVVEDEPPIREILKFQLEGAGYQVRCARDGAAGLQMAREDPPDLMLLDVMMPEMDGFEVCR